MRRQLIIEPYGWPCALFACPPGFFMFQDMLCFKTEYHPEGDVEVYCDSGEVFWGGTDKRELRRGLVVQPVKTKWIEIE